MKREEESKEPGKEGVKGEALSGEKKSSKEAFKQFQRVRITTEKLTSKESEEYHAAKIGDEVGDPMKATSGPAISVLMKQICMISLIFGDFFALHALFPVAA